MKNLICAKDVEAAGKQGKKVFYIDGNTLLTPSAKDAARAYGMEFSTEAPVCEAKVSEAAKICHDGLDSDMIYNVFKAMMDKGLLNGLLDSFSNKPYVADVDCGGLKVVRGNTVKMDVFDTGNPDHKVFYQEIINSNDGCSMNAGFITIEGCTFDWETTCEELYHVVEGTLNVTVNGKVYTAHPGDAVFFPKGAKLAFGSPDKMKAFYATH
jgi:ethanolamine utilization protein EutQ